MGNSAHSRVSKDGGSEGSPKSSSQQKSLTESDDGSKGLVDPNAPAPAENGPRNKALEMELNVKPDPLTEKQMAMLQENWKELEDNISKVGVITFISLFETHPDVQEVFMPFKGIELEELRHSKQLKAHALRVMAFVQKAVARLYEPEKLDILLRELGKKHYSYGAKQEHIDYIGPQFVLAIKPSLEDRWTDELQEAWLALFNYMGVIIKASMELEERRAAAHTIPYVPPTAAPKSPPSTAANAANSSPSSVAPATAPNPAPAGILPVGSSSPSEVNRRASEVINKSTSKGGTARENLRRGTVN